MKNKETVLFTNIGTCLPTQTDGLIRLTLTLSTLGADDHGDINVKLANVNNSNQCCEPW